jgi:hypothetical protein
MESVQIWDNKAVSTSAHTTKGTAPRPSNYLKKWTDADVKTVKVMLKSGSKPEAIAEKLKRTPTAIYRWLHRIIIAMTVEGYTPTEISAEISTPVEYITIFLQYNSKKVEAKINSMTKTSPTDVSIDDIDNLLSVLVEIRDLLKVLVERFPTSK